MLHTVFPLADPPADPDAWGRMVLRLHSYALANGYIAAAVYGETPADVHAYYVRRSFVHSDEVVRQLRGLDYRWYRTGQVCEDYAELPRDQTDGLWR